MSGYEQAREVEWQGSTYKVIVKREADNSLPLAVGDDNTKYFDNKITVRILRKDGTEFLNRTFLKTDFTGYLDKNTQQMGHCLVWSMYRLRVITWFCRKCWISRCNK